MIQFSAPANIKIKVFLTLTGLWKALWSFQYFRAHLNTSLRINLEPGQNYWMERITIEFSSIIE